LQEPSQQWRILKHQHNTELDNNPSAPRNKYHPRTQNQHKHRNKHQQTALQRDDRSFWNQKQNKKGTPDINSMVSLNLKIKTPFSNQDLKTLTPQQHTQHGETPVYQSSNTCLTSYHAWTQYSTEYKDATPQKREQKGITHQ
jgi:hypothetical protein